MTARNRFSNWARRGHWEKIFDALKIEVDYDGLILDASIVRAHQDSAGGKGGASGMHWVVLEVDSPREFAPVKWICDSEQAPCQGVPDGELRCSEAWPCGGYAQALVGLTASRQSDGTPQFASAEGCGYLIIEVRGGPGVPTRVFFDQSGALVGTWSMLQDVADSPEVCSGTVPVNCIDYEGESITQVSDLWAATNGGIQRDPGV